MRARKFMLAGILAGAVCAAGAVSYVREARLARAADVLIAWIFKEPVELAAANSVPKADGPPAIRVNGSQPLITPTLTLTGEVDSVPGTGLEPLTVTVYAGGKSYPATIVQRLYEEPVYTAHLSGITDSDMVRIVAVSENAQYHSVAGSIAKLRRLAQSDKHLDFNEYQPLRVSPWSSALAWMVTKALGRDASNDQEIERATRSIDYFDAAAVSYVLFDTAYGFSALPAGISDGWQLLSDEAAFRSLRLTLENQPNPYLFQNRAAEFFFDQQDYARFTSLSQIPDATLMLGGEPIADVPVDLSDLSVSPASSDSQLLMRNTDGTFNLYEPRSRQVVPYSAVVSERDEVRDQAAGEIILTPMVQVSELVTRTTWFSPNTPVRVLRKLTRRSVRRYFVGETSSVWAVAVHWTESYPDFPGRTPETTSDYKFQVMYDLDQRRVRDAWSGLSGKRALPWICASATSLSVCEHALYRFDPQGAGAVEDLGRKLDSNFAPVAGGTQGALSWSVDATGGLRTQLPDANVVFWAITGGNSAALSVVYLATGRTAGTSSQALFGQTLAIQADQNLDTSGIAAGKWLSGFSVAIPVRYPDPDQQMTFDRRSDGTTHDEVSEYGQVVDSWPGNWQTFLGRSYDYRVNAVFSTGPRWVVGCTEAFAAGASRCAPQRARYFRPLRRVGDRIYGIEEIYLNQSAARPPGDTSPYQVLRASSRPGFHVCVDARCVSAAPAIAAPLRTSSTRNGAISRALSRGRFPMRGLQRR